MNIIFVHDNHEGKIRVSYLTIEILDARGIIFHEKASL